MYSYPGEIVLDPFIGSGQTLKVAYWLKRQYAGYEIISKYAKLAKRRITEPLSIRPKQLIAVFDKVGLDEATNKEQSKRLDERDGGQGKAASVQPLLFETKSDYES
jgi:adenine specific DNA methylase Mod